ncbi:hypothetical protein ILYODFUR_038313 [Ilyodon furcidens]|uniref:Uncharacterized protein n=1 Tax=Ilyodon furcidens TaxID=33524 RepID=A0ABV0UFX8_9TELE
MCALKFIAQCFPMLLSSFSICSECAKRHLGPVWQLRWNQQELSFTGEEKVEALFSVGADGRICKWFVINGGLDCTGVVLNSKICLLKFHFIVLLDPRRDKIKQ